MHSVVQANPHRVPVEFGNLIVSPQAYARRGQLLAAFERMRKQGPLGLVEVAHFEPFWAVTAHAAIRAISRQNEIFRNGERATALVPRATDLKVRELTGGHPHLIRSLVHMDAPDHLRYRRITQAWFAGHNVQSLQHRIRELARIGLNRIAALDGGCEFVRDVARPFPLRVMMDLIGLPQNDSDLLLALTEAFFRSQHEWDAAGEDERGARDPARHARHLLKVLAGFRSYFEPLLMARRIAPRDDALSAIANATIDGQAIPMLEAVSYLLLLATAGHHTTSSSIAGGVLALSQYPGEMRKVSSDRTLIPGLVEESVRWTTPVQHFMRTATRDTEICGQAVAAGDWLMLCYLSGNRDEAVFDEAEKFRVDRRTGSTVAFGDGVHACLGQHLARLEMTIFFEEMLARIEAVEPAGEARYSASIFVGGPIHVPLRFKLRKRPERTVD